MAGALSIMLVDFQFNGSSEAAANSMSTNILITSTMLRACIMLVVVYHRQGIKSIVSRAADD